MLQCPIFSNPIILRCDSCYSLFRVNSCSRLRLTTANPNPNPYPNPNLTLVKSAVVNGSPCTRLRIYVTDCSYSIVQSIKVLCNQKFWPL